MKPWRLYSLSALLTALAFSAALTYARRDTTPPQVYIEVPAEVPAELAFDVFISADEPVTYEVRYGDTELNEVAQAFTLSLTAEVGDVPLRVSATDAAQNESVYDYTVRGIPKLEADLTVTPELIPGEPLRLDVTWQGGELTALEMGLGGEAVVPFVRGQQATVLMGVPLGSEAGSLEAFASLTDEYGRQTRLARPVSVLPDPRPVQELNLSSGTLSVITPEGRALESAMIAAAYERVGEVADPLWTEPFVLPLEGRDTSGFGSPRRYAAGGNVSYHNGSDTAAPAGTPILATNTGRVLVADFYPIKGGFTLIDHGAGLYSYYLHQSALHVAAGERVERGQVIGEVGSTGLSTGPHLHWEMRLRGVATNPMSWVGKVLP